MAKKRVTFSFSGEVIKEPVIHNLGQQFHIVTNILSANVSESAGWITLELSGEKEDIENGIDWVTSKGIRVDEDI